MIGNPGTDDDGIEPETDDVLRSSLRACADLVAIPAPPIAAVRRRAQRRRKRRGVIQGLSGLAAMCAVVAAIVAWSPGRDVIGGPVPPHTEASSPTWTVTSADAALDASHTTSAAAFLQASDLGPGWKGPIGSQGERTQFSPGVLTQCGSAGPYRPQVPVTPATDHIYREYSPSGKLTNAAEEAVYTFAAGTGPVVMDKARAALNSCKESNFIKILSSPSTVADEAIVFTVGGDTRNLLVRSGDRVASVLVNTVSPGPDGAAWTDALAKEMARRLTVALAR